MMILNNPHTANDFNDKKQPFEIGFEPSPDSKPLLVDITLFLSIIKSCYDAVDKKTKRVQIQKLLDAKDWVEHSKDKETGRRILLESQVIEHKHELQTAILLTKANYDVVFAPVGMFNRFQKRFDMFLLRDTILLRADLKCIASKNAETIAKRIIEGSEQASAVVVEIRSDISQDDMIMALIKGVERNKLIDQVLLIYKRKFYVLHKNLILSKNIFNVLK